MFSALYGALRNFAGIAETDGNVYKTTVYESILRCQEQSWGNYFSVFAEAFKIYQPLPFRQMISRIRIQER
jgi:hypothetical protein